MRVQCPTLGFDQPVRAVGVSAPPAGLDGSVVQRFFGQWRQRLPPRGAGEPGLCGAVRCGRRIPNQSPAFLDVIGCSPRCELAVCGGDDPDRGAGLAEVAFSA